MIQAHRRGFEAKAAVAVVRAPDVRLVLATLAVAFLAGCSGPEPPATQDLPNGSAPALVTPPLLVLADGTYTYHEVSTNGGALEAYDFASQAVANPCSWNGGAYFNNRQVPTAGAPQRHRNGTLRITFDWTDEDYPFPTLVAGYQAPGMDDLVDSPRIPRGQTLEIRIEAQPGARNDGWMLFACINRSDENPSDPDWQPGPFLGDFTVRAEFQGDPEPPLVEPEGDGRRTSRS
jgi:hypothetical protein